MSKRYTVSEVRQRLADALDEADRGIPVIIERRGARYQLSLAPGKPRRSPRQRKPRIDVIDPAVEDGSWSWTWTARGIAFRSRRAK